MNKTVETVLKLVLSGKGHPINCKNFRLTDTASHKLFERVTEALRMMGIPYKEPKEFHIHVLNEQQLEDSRLFKVIETYSLAKKNLSVDFSSSLKDGIAVSKVTWDKITGVKVESVIVDDFYEDLT